MIFRLRKKKEKLKACQKIKRNYNSISDRKFKIICKHEKRTQNMKT